MTSPKRPLSFLAILALVLLLAAPPAAGQERTTCVRYQGFQQCIHH